MSNILDVSVTPNAFDRTVADLKQGVASATSVNTELSQKAVNTAKSFADFNKGSWTAFSEASQIFAAGTQSLMKQMVASSQAAYAESLSNFRALATAKTFKERIELQSNLLRTSAVRAVSESSRFAHESIELAEKASAPLTARAVLAAETLSTFKA